MQGGAAGVGNGQELRPERKTFTTKIPRIRRVSGGILFHNSLLSLLWKNDNVDTAVLLPPDLGIISGNGIALPETPRVEQRRGNP